MTLTWIKSSYSGANGGNCVEMAIGDPDLVPVRDSKAPERATLTFKRAGWDAFLRGVKTGTLAHP
ncbi:DUF397 domain-containing protein [Streptomyces sp. ODS28]|uniref:DUF397 domain-containing protein n=1 Tax=Streptomyces sp. ODS28 TaxID=3136688 RepID=UPI0031E7C659